MLHLLEPAAIHDNERKIAALLRGYLRKESLQGGVTTFVRGGIVSFSIDRDIVNATVQDNIAFYVRLNMSFLPYSKCSCAHNRNGCTHIAAVLFKLLSYQGLRIEPFVADNNIGVWPANSAAEPAVRTEFESDISAAAQSRGQAPSKAQSQPASSSQLVLSEASYQQWHQEFRKLLPSRQLIYIVQWKAMAAKIEKILCAEAERWSDARLADLFRLHALLYGLHALDDASRYHYYHDEEFESESRQLLNRLAETLISIDRETINQDSGYRQHLEGVGIMLHQYAFQHSNGVVDWLHIFRSIWSRLLTDSDMRDKAKHTLLKDTNKPGLPNDLRDRLFAAAAHFVLLKEGNEEAIDFLDKRLKDKRASDYFDYLHTFLMTRDWARLYPWLRWLQKFIFKSQGEYIGYFLETWKTAAEATEGMEEWTEAVRNLMPYSIEYYADYLIGQEDYDRWVDAHMTWEMNPEYHNPEGLRRVEKASPRALLPLYHGRVWQLIEARSRQGYKEAVREMKKLKKLYTRLKMELQWRLFLDRLMIQYARLRALHEEMRKGRLIS